MKTKKIPTEVQKEVRRYYWKINGIGGAISFVFFGILGLMMWITNRD